VMQPKKLGLVFKPLEDGLIKEKSHLSSRQEDIDLLTSMNTLQQEKTFQNSKSNQKLQFSIVEYPRSNNLMTLNVKSILLKTNFQTTKSSKTLDRASTGKEKVLSPYWKELCVEKSKKLLSVTGIDSVVLDSSLLNLSSQQTKQDSWYTTKKSSKVPNKNLPKISWQSYMSSHIEKWGGGDSLKESRRSLKTKMFPTIAQAKILRRWIKDARLTYNTAINRLKSKTNKVHKYSLVAELVIRKNTKITDPKFLEAMDRTPTAIRLKALFEACAAHNLSVDRKSIVNPRYIIQEKLIKTEQTKIDNNEKILEKVNKFRKDLEHMKPTTKSYLNKLISIDKLEEKIVKTMDIQKLTETLESIPKFSRKESKVKFRKCKSQYSHIFIPKLRASVEDKKLTVYTKYNIGPIRILNNVDVEADFQIQYNERSNSWYMINSFLTKSESSSKTNSIISIDPGIRTFLTGIDSEGNIHEIGADWDEKIRPRMNKLDKCESAKINGKRKGERYNVVIAKRIANLHRKKIRNLIDEMHKKVSLDLLRNHEYIILPKMNTKRMLKSEDSLGKDVNRRINILSHGKFHDYITWKSKMMGKIVINQDESYTTQTCYQCGILNNIGSNKIYSCEHCGHTCDRDIQSSLNILTKFMGSYSPRAEGDGLVSGYDEG